MAIDWIRLNRRFNLTSSILLIGEMHTARGDEQTYYGKYFSYTFSYMSLYMGNTKSGPFQKQFMIS